MFSWINFLRFLKDEDDMADHYEQIDKWIGATPASENKIQLGIQDGDPVKVVKFETAITDTQLRSVHEQDDATDYKNTSGFKAMVVLIIQATTFGTAIRKFKVYSAPTTDSKVAATEVYDFSPNASILNASAEKWTTPPLKIQDDHFIVIENLSGDGDSDLIVNLDSRVVERQT